jgi:acylphosphatase
MKRIRVKISGDVQGVFYRKSALEKAQDLGLVGWVKNLSNGSVLAEAQGEQAAVEDFITWCYQGPDAALVTGVETEAVELEDDRDFIILF